MSGCDSGSSDRPISGDNCMNSIDSVTGACCQFPECCRDLLDVLETQVLSLQAAAHVGTELTPITRAVTVEDMMVSEAVQAASTGAQSAVSDDFAEAVHSLPEATRCRRILQHLTLHEARSARGDCERQIAAYWRQIARIWRCY